MIDIDDAVAAIRDGDLIIYPTETCYGLGCDALDRDAVERVYAAKQRPREKKLTVVVADMAMAEEYCVLSDVERRICEAFMPGPLTLITEKRENVPDLLNDQFAFRVPDHDVAQALPRRAGVPVVATSANISGQGPHYTVDTISGSVRSAADAVIDAGTLPRRRSSTIVTVADGAVDVVRAGPISGDAVRGVVDE